MAEREGAKGRQAYFHNSDLGDQELGDSFRQFALLAGQDHLQHVAMQLLHDNKDPLWRLKHTLQVDDTWVVQILKDKQIMTSSGNFGFHRTVMVCSSC